MVGLYCDPKGDNVFGDKQSSARVIRNIDIISPFNNEHPTTVAELEERIRELENAKATILALVCIF